MNLTYLGIDFHKKYSLCKLINDEGLIVAQRKLLNIRKDFESFLKPYPETKAVVEACWNWHIAVDLLEGLVDKIVLANPYKVRAIAEAKIKTDSIDAYTLAQLLRADLIPEAYLRDKENRKKQKILRSRCFYVRMQTRIKNKIHILIDSQEEEVRETAKVFSDLFGKKGLNWLKSLSFENNREDNELLKDYLEIYELFERKKKKSESLLKEILVKDKDCELLMSIPGIGLFLSVLIKTEIGDINRFRNASKLCSYAGIVPSTYSSGGKTYHGKITKQGNKWLRWGLIESVRGAIISNMELRSYYEYMKRKKGAKKARVVIAKRILHIIYRVLKEKDTFKQNKNDIQQKYKAVLLRV